jgi:hypothetical protein
MTIAPPASDRNSQTAGSAWRTYLPGAAGVAYVVAWVAGLAAWPANLALNATAGQVAAAYRAHHTGATVQYLLVEGVAGVLLGVVLACVLRAARDQVGRRAAGPAVLSAIAVLTSLTQTVIGLFGIAAASGGPASRAGTLFDLVDRLDGVKMLALAAAAIWLAVSGPVLPRWLRGAGILLGLALITSGCTYLTLWNPLAWAVYVSGPLLLLWVAGSGLALTMAAGRR